MTTIESFKWGEVHTIYKGRRDVWKDCIITDDGPQNWNWNLDGTKHNPGVTVAALLPLQNCSTIIVSTGVHQRLQVTREARELLQSWGVLHYILDSNSAVAKFNKISAGGGSVGLLLHSTC